MTYGVLLCSSFTFRWDSFTFYKYINISFNVVEWLMASCCVVRLRFADDKLRSFPYHRHKRLMSRVPHVWSIYFGEKKRNLESVDYKWQPQQWKPRCKVNNC
jgi:hypothetical protein